MSGLISMIVIAVVALAVGTYGAHDAAFKSFGGTSNECRQYLNNDGNGECNVHCVGVVSHSWNDTMANFLQSYAGYFVPDPSDQCYENRTMRCMADVYESVPVYDKCARANRLGQCYADQYGELDTSMLQYVPMTDLQYTRVFLQCAAMLGVSQSDLDAMVCQGAYNVPAGACLLRCTLIRMGLYNDDTGINVPYAVRQCGLYNATSNIEQCQAKVVAEECDKCTRAVRIAQECLGMHYVLRNYGQSYALELYGYCPCNYYYYYYPYCQECFSIYLSSGSSSYSSANFVKFGK